MAQGVIRIRNAKEHNLKSLSIDIPKNTFTVITGVSGSGKSSLAYDTIFKEGQRRYIASLSSYARQFMNQTDNPKVDLVEGLSPTLCIDQKSVGRNPRSTVGTITEIYDFIRLLYSRLGTANCPNGHGQIASQTPELIGHYLYGDFADDDVLVMAPVVLDRKGEYRKELADLGAKGFVRAVIDGELLRLDEPIELARYERHRIEVVVDRLRVNSDNKPRLDEAVRKATELSDGRVSILRSTGSSSRGSKASVDLGDGYRLYSTTNSCSVCGYSIPELEPGLFSFNVPKGACPDCNGMGYMMRFDPSTYVKDASKGVFDGALFVINDKGNVLFANTGREKIVRLYAHYKQPLDRAWKKLPVAFRNRLTQAGPTSPRDGVAFSLSHELECIYNKYKIPVMERYMRRVECGACDGERLNELARNVLFEGRRIHDLVSMQVKGLLAFFRGGDFSAHNELVMKPILKELLNRLSFLEKVGLEYLTLERRANTLSGGEAQRIRLASQVGSGLEGCLYILDEPSIGLHQSDNKKLIATLKQLRNQFNTVLVIEHDEETILAADHVVDIGPAAGSMGGEVCFSGEPKKLIDALSVAGKPSRSETANYIAGGATISLPERRRSSEKKLSLRGLRRHNLKGLDAEFSLGVLTVLTGVSGSGKSTLMELVHEAVQAGLARPGSKPGARASVGFRSVRGNEALTKVIEIDQKPIGRTSRSNPATYTKVWDLVRDLFALLPESRIRGYPKGRFSFNVPGGRCEPCGGSGVIEVDMQIFSNVETVCEACNGKRFNSNTLDIHYKGKTIYDVLEMTVEEAKHFFAESTKICRILETMESIGLGYLRLGQTSPTLSGGEAQRIKLAAELSKPLSKSTLYLLDEPTTGLHFSDIEKLLSALQRLVDKGHTVVMIEHNLDVIKSADVVVEMGPGGGDAGGRIVFSGTPEQIARSSTPTGTELKHFLTRQRKREAGHYLKRFGELFKGESNEASQAKPIAADRSRRRILIEGLLKNNLKNIDVSLPKNQIITFTGVSGSGKTSLALDTIFKEGQRKYIDSLSTYARRFLGRVEQPKVRRMEGISPTIAVDQRAGSKNPRSTLATQTEIYDSFRVLYANVGSLHCEVCNKRLEAHTASDAAKKILKERNGEQGLLLAPLFMSNSPKKFLLESKEKLLVFKNVLAERGYLRFLADDELLHFEEPDSKLNQALSNASNLFLVIDRPQIVPKNMDRLVDGFEKAYEVGEGNAFIRLNANETMAFSTHPSCFEHYAFQEEKLTPRHFSFNHHLGACEQCDGIGRSLAFQEKVFVADKNLPLLRGAIAKRYQWLFTLADQKKLNLKPLSKAMGVDFWESPFANLQANERRFLFYGKPYDDLSFEFQRQRSWKGLAKFVELGIREGARARRSSRADFSDCFRMDVCPECNGGRLKARFLATKVAGKGIAELTAMNLEEAEGFFKKLPNLLGASERTIVKELLGEIQFRLSQMTCLGLGYLTLDRTMANLSGGEVQRIRLSTQIGNKLEDVIYLLDEPTIGLHERDTEQLLEAIRNLKQLGNTVILVEHDENIIRSSDWITDLGPAAGEHGGRVIYNGKNDQRRLRKASFYPYLYGDKSSSEATLRPFRNPVFDLASDPHLKLLKVEQNNIRGADLELPLYKLIGVSGVSGSGKSSLVFDWLLPRARQWLSGGGEELAEQLQFHSGGERLQHIPYRSVVVLDQAPVSTSLRSVAASYLELLPHIRKVFATTRTARELGFHESFFSFNAPQGRCDACFGSGNLAIQMHFISDVFVACDACKGRRYRKEVLEVYYKGKNISDVLNLTFSEAVSFFEGRKSIRDKVQMIVDCGLGYLRLGMNTNLLSGGELQRLKIAKELSKKSDMRDNLYLMDEPTTGLHHADIEVFVGVVDKLVGRGNTVVVIEHNPYFLSQVDYLIDMGPEAGSGGGSVVNAGSPEEVRAAGKGYTARYL